MAGLTIVFFKSLKKFKIESLKFCSLSLYFRLKNSTVLIALLFLNCIEPVSPEFDFESGLLFIDGIIDTNPGSSYVRISKSNIEFERYTSEFITEATVLYKNIGTEETIRLIEDEGVFLPPIDFVGLPGEIWQLKIVLGDGSQYESAPETIADPVEIATLEAFYEKELLFTEESNSFIPGHSVSVSFVDPPDADNFYYWNFRSYENLPYCLRCEESIFRNGKCDEEDPNAAAVPYYDYQCDPECWQIRYSESINIFSDEFVSARSISRLPIALIPLFTKEDIVVEVQQQSISANAYKYFKILKDIIDNNGSLNAPPPAALIGNMTKIDDSNEAVFGRFTSAATTIRSVFIDRTEIDESPLSFQGFINEETCDVCPPGICPTRICRPVLVAPCEENRYRTSLIPSGWIEQ